MNILVSREQKRKKTKGASLQHLPALSFGKLRGKGGHLHPQLALTRVPHRPGKGLLQKLVARTEIKLGWKRGTIA